MLRIIVRVKTEIASVTIQMDECRFDFEFLFMGH